MSFNFLPVQIPTFFVVSSSHRRPAMLVPLLGRPGCLALLCITVLWPSILCPVLQGQTAAVSESGGSDFEAGSHLPAGFQLITGRYVDIVTDLPIDDELRLLPQVFEQAMPLWCQAFGVPPEDVSDWHARAYVMLERDRFEKAGMIPEHLPEFPYGFQYGNDLWVSEQPSAYYRRHLLLHEGTHWFMNRYFGSSGPPWLMEGMAELLATHRWDAQQVNLQMGIVPGSRDDVPYWGRISRVQQQLEDGSAPSLEAIMRYGNTAHREVEAYAWSWAAVLFLMEQPDTKAAFQEMLQQPMRSDLTQTRWLFERLRERWPKIRQQWNAFVSDLDYGFQSDAGLMVISAAPQAITRESVELQVDSRKSWQASGIYVTAGQRIQVAADGSFVVGRVPADWRSEADGVTLEYHNGHPLGRLMMAVAAPMRSEEASRVINEWPVGSGREIDLTQSGELFFRLNEASHERADNEGAITVRVELLQ
ncbi:MAG: hypothetical protein NXI32_10595 [bacterium]|nr:hypothetical protein [bacterium]